MKNVVAPPLIPAWSRRAIAFQLSRTSLTLIRKSQRLEKAYTTGVSRRPFLRTPFVVPRLSPTHGSTASASTESQRWRDKSVAIDTARKNDENGGYSLRPQTSKSAASFTRLLLLKLNATHEAVDKKKPRIQEKGTSSFREPERNMHTILRPAYKDFDP
jgi:hypothetical protein